MGYTLAAGDWLQSAKVVPRWCRPSRMRSTRCWSPVPMR